MYGWKERLASYELAAEKPHSQVRILVMVSLYTYIYINEAREPDSVSSKHAEYTESLASCLRRQDGRVPTSTNNLTFRLLRRDSIYRHRAVISRRLLEDDEECFGCLYDKAGGSESLTT